MVIHAVGRTIRASIGGLYTRHPVLCNMALYGSLYASGDVSQQTLLQKPTYDWENTARLGAVGSILGPGLYLWYTRLDRWLPGKARVTVVKKIVLDQCIAGALSALVFYSATTALQKDGKVWEEVKTKWPRAFATGCFYWPIVQFVNFTFLPNHMRTVCVGVAAFVWTNFLCYLKSVKLPDPAGADALMESKTSKQAQ